MIISINYVATVFTNVKFYINYYSILLHFKISCFFNNRKEYASDTAEPNTSRRNSAKHKEDFKQNTNSPILSRLRPPTPKLTNSPIVTRKAAVAKILNSPMLERPKHLAKQSQATNIGYFTCVENRYLYFSYITYNFETIQRLVSK